MKKLLTFLLATMLSAVGASAMADSGKGHGHGAASAKAADAASTAMTVGEVRKVDKDAGKITIKHEPLAKLDMPAMTMVFRVKDPAMLDQVKSGDKIKFEADKVGGAFTVVKLEVVQ